MKRSKLAGARVSHMSRRLWAECLKEVEEEMQLEASKRMRLVPRGYIRLRDTQQRVGPPAELLTSAPLRKMSSHNDHAHQRIVKNGRNPLEDHLYAQPHHTATHETDTLENILHKRHVGIAIHEQVSLEDAPDQHQQVVKEEQDPLETNLSEEHREIIKDEQDPLQADLPEQHQQHTVKEEPDPLEVEKDPLETHSPQQMVIKTECDDEQEAAQSFDAELRCWALTHQIQPAAFNELLALLRPTNNFERPES